MVANALTAFTLPVTGLISAATPGFVDLNLALHFMRSYYIILPPIILRPSLLVILREHFGFAQCKLRDRRISLRVLAQGDKINSYHIVYRLLKLCDNLASNSRAWHAASGDRDASPQEGVSKLDLHICLKLVPFRVKGAIASPRRS